MDSALRCETRTISIDSAPDTVLDLVADPYRLPDWAPNFARTVRPDGDDWLIKSDGTEIRITVRVSREHGTVDLLRSTDPPRGAFSRVLPNGGGSEYLFTLFFADGTQAAPVAAQMTTVEEELQTVRTLCEHSNPTHQAG